MKNTSIIADQILKESEEKNKSDKFFLGKNNPEIEKNFKERESQAAQHAKEHPPVGITWSPAVNWHGFKQHFSFAKTLDGRQLFKTEAENMIQLSMNKKQTYMTKKEFEQHIKKIEPFLQKNLGVSGGYWRS